ncbi:hypothetical protein [Mitsuokella multacida]|uniref:hypothetical protein n=1 Tax=Mitsuokella multacida TaxID=52226 RepID=UPI001F37C11D|nr:hypothetical protein [Mitsuokella multacida]MCF2585652.1 hypothetical protein [Mitsuokella multacida]
MLTAAKVLEDLTVVIGDCQLHRNPSFLLLHFLRFFSAFLPISNLSTNHDNFFITSLPIDVNPFPIAPICSGRHVSDGETVQRWTFFRKKNSVIAFCFLFVLK